MKLNGNRRRVDCFRVLLITLVALSASACGGSAETGKCADMRPATSGGGDEASLSGRAPRHGTAPLGRGMSQ